MKSYADFRRLMIIGTTATLLIACQTESTRPGRGGRTRNTNTSTTPGGGNGNTTPPPVTASVDLEDLLCIALI